MAAARQLSVFRPLKEKREDAEAGLHLGVARRGNSVDDAMVG